MKREYIALIFLSAFIVIYFCAGYLTEKGAGDFIHKFIVTWLLMAFFAGQYSIKFPKRF